jgi:protein-S-isoprenylcysteine O-methyltransferase Ste14
MNNFERIFGSGPKGLFFSIVLLFLLYLIKKALHIPDIFPDHYALRFVLFILLTMVSVIIIIWSIISLNPKLRGKKLITTGALRYFRHPLYAAFLSFFNFGLAILLNNWVFIAWAIILHPIWHLLITKEENALKSIFPNEYDNYCKKTGRFFPRLNKN